MEKGQRLLISGYVRNMERVYIFENIPNVINDIIYLFLKFYDQWSTKYSSSKIEIDKDGLSFVVKEDACHSAFGEHVVRDGLFVWRIQIMVNQIDADEHEGPYVGVIVDNEDNLARYADGDNWEDCGYQWCAVNGTFVTNNKMSCSGRGNYLLEWDGKGDILEISLNLNELTLRFKVNDKDRGVAVKDIEKTAYRLVLTSDVDQSLSKYALV